MLNNWSKILPLFVRNWLWAERAENGHRYNCGLKPDKDTHKDYDLGWFWGGDYESPNDEVDIKPLEVKNQNGDNTCGQESWTSVCEDDEKVILSEESHTCLMKKTGRISQNGFSSLKGNIQCSIDNGIAEKRLLNKGHKVGWEEYSSEKNLTPEVVENAKLHKTKSFFSVNDNPLKEKSLDQNKTIYTGMNWYSGFNARGGYKAGQVIDKPLGHYVGDHAVKIRGKIKKNFKCRVTGKIFPLVFKYQNSYGETYGDKGCFYVSAEYLNAHSYPAYVRVDMPIDLAKFLNEYEGEYVKVHDNGAIWKIVNGKKRAFPDSETYIFCSGKWGDQKGYRYVDDEFPGGKELLKQVRDDFDMSAYDAEVMDVVKKYPKEFKALLSSKHLQEEVLKRL